jgi:hypothetical protein
LICGVRLLVSGLAEVYLLDLGDGQHLVELIPPDLLEGLLLLPPHALPDIPTDGHVLVVDDVDQVFLPDLSLRQLLLQVIYLPLLFVFHLGNLVMVVVGLLSVLLLPPDLEGFDLFGEVFLDALVLVLQLLDPFDEGSLFLVELLPVLELGLKLLFQVLVLLLGLGGLFLDQAGELLFRGLSLLSLLCELLLELGELCGQ